MSVLADSPIKRVIIIVQENHTTDNYFQGLARCGVAVATDWPLSPNPPSGTNHMIAMLTTIG
jgi:phospholipase C